MKKLFFLTVLTLVWLSCSKDDEPGMSHLKVMLTDAPGDYQQVNIDIQGVEVHAAGGDSTSGWASLDVDTGVYNLLLLTNGLDTLLGEADVPAGRVSQIRLLLGSNNSIMVDSVLYPLTIPSGSQSGLKLNVHEDLAAGTTYVFTLDFDAAKSIVLRGNGTYALKPVIRVITAITVATTGSIEGMIDPPEAITAVYAINPVDTVATTFSDSTGHFLLGNITPGIYTISFEPGTGFNPVVRYPVTVTVSQVTDLGVIDVH